MEKLGKLANETGLAELSSHKLRHNFATNWCIEGYIRDGYVDNIKLAVIMGHEDIHTTQRYMHEAQSVVSTTHFRSHLDDIMPESRRKRFEESFSWDDENDDDEEEGI